MSILFEPIDLESEGGVAACPFSASFPEFGHKKTGEPAEANIRPTSLKDIFFYKQLFQRDQTFMKPEKPTLLMPEEKVFTLFLLDLYLQNHGSDGIYPSLELPQSL